MLNSLRPEPRCPQVQRELGRARQLPDERPRRQRRTQRRPRLLGELRHVQEPGGPARHQVPNSEVRGHFFT